MYSYLFIKSTIFIFRHTKKRTQSVTIGSWNIFSCFCGHVQRINGAAWHNAFLGEAELN